MADSRKWISFEFTALTVILLTAICNVSVFYSFYHYLGTIGIPVAWRGFLVGLEPMTSFILRIVILPWLHVRNALAVILASLCLLVAVSCSYMFVQSVPALIVVRLLHGTAFVLLTSGTVALVVNFIPKEHSGQGFGIITIATLIPYAVIPPATEALLPYVRSEADLYAGVSVFAIVAILLTLALRARLQSGLPGGDGVLLRRPTLDEIRVNLGQRAVATLLSALLLVYLAHATVFYFLKDLALATRGGDVGLFLGLSMVTMIAVRSLGGVCFDKGNKLLLLEAGLFLLLPCLLALPLARSGAAFYALAGLYGLCMGVILPLLNALIFIASPPQLRGVNTNFGLFAMDAAYCFTPYLGGTLIALGAGFGHLFELAAGIILICLLLIVHLQRRWKPEP